MKLLGCLLDCKLLISHGIENILARMRPKVRAILRLRGHYPIKELLGQFKTHVWGLVEYQNGAIFHASAHHLQKIERVQDKFLEELGLDTQKAFLDYNFAPLDVRRNIGILGLLHKRVLGLSHPIFQELLPFFGDVFGYQIEGRHGRQLYGQFLEVSFQYDIFQRSIFAMCSVYNNLSQDVVDEPTVSLFQSRLTRILKDECMKGNPQWRNKFSCRT